MYDFTKLDITYIGWDELQKNPNLEWRPLGDHNGELNPLYKDRYGRKKIRPDYFAEYKNMIIEVFNTSSNAEHPLRIESSGSLH